LAHAYVTFRFHLARHGLRQFFASLKSSGEILLLVGANVALALFALSAFPPMYAATLAPLDGIALLAGHALAMAIPIILLRKRVLPADVIRWSQRLPIPPAVQWRAEAAVAGLLVGPLALFYLVSVAILLAEGPAWLTPASGIPATLASLLITYGCAIGALRLRSRPAAPARAARAHAAAAPYQVRSRLGRLPLLWHRLFWLPFWRAENVVGLQQSVMLAAALASSAAWMQAAPGMPRALLALASAALMVLLTDRGDKAVREQTALLRPVMASWPLDARAVFAVARAFALAPALLVLLAVAAAGARHGLWQHTAGRIYLALGCASQVLLVATPVSNERFRVSLVVISIVLLTAVGSELWT
jgi:hypothetical protein